MANEWHMAWFLLLTPTLFRGEACIGDGTLDYQHPSVPDLQKEEGATAGHFKHGRWSVTYVNLLSVLQSVSGSLPNSLGLVIH